MPTYVVTDKTTGKSMDMPWNGQTPPTDADVEAFVKAPRLAPPSANEPVTLGQLMDNRSESLGRMGHLLYTDATNPRNLAGLAAGLLMPGLLKTIGPALTPKEFGPASPGVVPRMQAVTGAIGDAAPDVVGMASPRLGNMMRVLQ